MSLSVLAQITNDALVTSESSSAGGGTTMVMTLFYLIFAVLVIAGLWKTFQKASKPGWGAIIPIYNIYLILKVAGRPGWWILLYLIPIVGLIVHIVVSLDVAKAFGKSAAFGIIGLWLFSAIGFLILGFGDAKYAGAPAH